MNRSRWISTFAAALVFAGYLVSLPASAATRVYVSIAPPAPVVETIPVAPSPRHVWVGGYHRWDGHAYVWVPGVYAIPPAHYAVWVPGHWSHHHSHGYYWVAGHWRKH